MDDYTVVNVKISVNRESAIDPFMDSEQQQKGLNETLSGLLRFFFPKSCDFRLLP